VHALSGDEELLVEAVLVGVLELNLSKGGTPARVVDDILDHTLDVALALGKVELTVLGGALPVEGVRLHSRRMDSTLIIDNLATTRERRKGEARHSLERKGRRTTYLEDASLTLPLAPDDTTHGSG
jgi:hypothetical protein